LSPYSLRYFRRCATRAAFASALARRGYASEQEERILIERRVSYVRAFDAQPCLGSALDDLSKSLFLIEYLQQAVAPEVIAENIRPVEQQLASLMPMAMEARKPVFSLKPADGAIGAHSQAARNAYTDFLELAQRIANRSGVVLS